MPTIRTAGCFLHYQDKFLILHRQPHKSQGGTWGVPAGKLNPGETDRLAVIREVHEETGYTINPSQLEDLGTHVFVFPEVTVQFPTFRIKLAQPIAVHINPDEHQAYAWVTAAECYAMPDLIHGVHDLLKRLGYVKNSKNLATQPD